MATDQRELSGALFRNDRRREGKNDSEYQGSCTINGVQYWMNAWVKEGAKGKFFSVAFKQKDPGAYVPAAPAKKPASVQPDYTPEGDEPPF